ncbi:recombinase family protein [Aquimarina algiphila]|uniref:Recombinase family protein n=1 Tax=Aquimarina algiphila TaxID=2047982 RepID=A0A554VNR6_9FLAO|nr:recombinase family protein [Aquimarina algiphila]TSE10015.1 recombinase family protein [Aquimarina algiphila]
MNTLEQFQDFAKKNKQKIISNNKAVIYTRVSDVKQKDNTSLESQKEICTEFALRNGFEICAYFGGTHESAKTDERKAYKEMLTYVKRKKITNIIVHSLDRYSRTGGLAIATVEELKKKGIKVISISQNVDSDTPTGTFMQSFHLLYSRYDNDIRRDKTITGMRHRLMQGYYMGLAPLGYKNARNDKNVPIIIPDENAKLVRKAFLWKVDENISNADIVERLQMQGLKIYRQRLTDIFRNPIYCGLISHGLLEGKVVQGNHEPIISKNIFLKVNGIQAKNNQNYKHNRENENLPLKGFTKCKSCGSPLTGFIVKKKGIYYYKCKTTGCSCTKNTKSLHEQFEKILSHFEIDKKWIAPLKKQLQFTFEYYFKSKKDDTTALKNTLKGLLEKIEKIEERYVIGEIDTQLYQKFIKKFNIEKEQIEEEIKTNSLKSSNLDFYIDNCIKLFSNLNRLWKLGNYNEKQRLQKLLFPKGILYSKEKDEVQTLQLNPVMELVNCLSMNYNKNKSGQNLALASLSAVVTQEGFKPPTLRAEI